MPSRTHSRTTFVFLAVVVAVAGLVVKGGAVTGTARARVGAESPPVAGHEAVAEERVVARWRFRVVSKPVKVVLLAGSVGAYQRKSYAYWMGEQCQNVELRNLSKTGYGAYKLRRHFQEQVLDNPRVRTHDARYEFWLVFQGGLNSIAEPQRTNYHLHRMFQLAHRHGFHVLGLSPTPWGDDRDRRRWAGARGLAYRGYTQRVVDFLLGRLGPEEALGRYASKRKVGADAPWEHEELADIGVDLYNSRLRDAMARARSLEQTRAIIAADPKWRQNHLSLSASQRAVALDRDTDAASRLPQWYLRPELRSFDHIHPNELGHRMMFDVMCGSLPRSWGCACGDAP
ncbi:MAG: hypothetical protein V3V08_25690 [Nannocystaceae bacterium]